MKTKSSKHYLLLFFILLSLTVSFNSCSDDNVNQEEIETYIPDNNFEQKLIDLGYDNVLDDYVLTSNIKDVVELNLEGLEIEDLTGIEDFVSLEKLWCSINQLTSLDVSNNTSLNELDCSSNQLTSLDVSKNTSLSLLVCSKNQLTSLDVSYNTELRYIYCYNNQLTNLDVSNNLFLWSLVCSNNQIICIKVNEFQINNKVSKWTKDDSSTWSLDCD